MENYPLFSEDFARRTICGDPASRLCVILCFLANDPCLSDIRKCERVVIWPLIGTISARDEHCYAYDGAFARLVKVGPSFQVACE